MSVYKADNIIFIQEALASLYQQTYKNIDILVQQDGPVSKEIDEYLTEELNTHKILFLGKRAVNKGLAYSLNELIINAVDNDYTYIFRMDSDDICAANRVELQHDYLVKHPEVDLLGGWIEEFNTDVDEKKVLRYPESHKDIFKLLVRRSPLAHVTVAFKTNFFKQFGLYDEHSKCEDLDLWVRAFHKGAVFHNLQEVLVHVRTNNAFFNRRRNQQRAAELWKIKVTATKQFKFGIKGYVFATAHYLVWMAPASLKQFFYKYFR